MKAENKQNKETKNQSSQFLKTDSGKTKSNAIEIPSISLPKGGGAIKGIDEKFSVNAVNGTASFSIPLPVSQARGVTPALNLSYNSGSGNGIFGLGWSLGLSSIKRKTDKELPKYQDAIDSDTFLFSEAEDLVPEYKKNNDGSFCKDANGNYVIHEKDSADTQYTIRFYKPRIEGLFARIERWFHKTSGEIKWRVITKENVTTLFGWSEDSRFSDPNPRNKNRIFKWLPEFVFDDKGNCAHYIYKKEDSTSIDHSLLHNKNRFLNNAITYTNLYLEKVLYGNKTPYKKFNDSFPDETDYMFQTVFDYGTLKKDEECDTINEWDFREDAFSEYKSGFEIRTTRLCKRVLLFHYFDELPNKSALVKSLNFKYTTDPLDPDNNGNDIEDTNVQKRLAFLKSITTYGYIRKKDGKYTSKNFPALEFKYQDHKWNSDTKSISPENLENAPVGLSTPYQFTDLFNEGLSGILTEQGSGWYYKHNLGNGDFGPAKLVTPKPSFAGLGSTLQLADLDADGGKQLVSYNNEPKGFFELTDDDEWEPFRYFESLPNIDFSDPNTRMLDLTGDGCPDAMISEDTVFTWYESAGRKGFDNVHKTPKPFDEEKGPHIVFAEPSQSIFLADMTGDGLSDIVRIRNGEVCFWPNLGYGKFGAKVGMDNAPVFDHPGSFNPSYLQLADIDGSGTTDIIYLGKNKFSCWLNLNGNEFSKAPFEIDAFPEIHSQSNITVTDLLGNGVACIVWSSSLAKDSHKPLKYIDLMDSKKPHVMTSYANNLGKKVTLEYTPSTKFYIKDKRAGRPWITKLHFPVHCISKTETRDEISGCRFVSTYKYHHGYYDHAEKEFRGFGMVEQTDTEDYDHWKKEDAQNIVEEKLHQPPVNTKTWFHTGAFLSREKILNQFAHEYWHEEMNRQGFSADNFETPLPDARLTGAPGLDASIMDHLSIQEWREALRACKSMTLRTEVFAKDAPPENATTDQIKKELTPYSVADKNCVIELLQPKGKNKHAVFVVKESETITYSYERNTEDPRIAHNLNIKLDEYGNVLESATVAYPRKIVDYSLPKETKFAHGSTLISFVQNSFTNDINGNDDYRLRLPSEVKTYELKGFPTNALYSVDDFQDILTASNEVDYHQIETDPAAGASQKRLIEHVKSLFYKNDLSGPLDPGQLESKALPYENYQLAYTQSLISDIFGGRVNAGLMYEGKYTPGKGDGTWWIRSGRTQFIEGAENASHAQNRFYMPVSYIDPFGAKTKVTYYKDYYLFIESTEDAIGNKISIDITNPEKGFNFRTLSPRRIKDPNDNVSEVLMDELGLVKAMAVFGKGNEADQLTGLYEFTSAAEKNQVTNFFIAPDSDQLTSIGKDLLKRATARFVYDFHAYKNTGKPAVVASIVREVHYKKQENNSPSPVQISFEYSDGLGQVAMKKVQAEPGEARKITINDDNTYTIDPVDTSELNPEQLRWIGSGRQVLNNKGNVVKAYEPYFSVTHQYEAHKELVETGVTPIMYYDAVGRLMKTEMPDGTFSKTEFNAWKQLVFDQNDTILETSWYNNRTNRRIDDKLAEAGKDPVKEKEAADKAAKHAGTPMVQHFDTLGRPVLSIEHNKNINDGTDEFYKTKVILDIEGNLRSVFDARELQENGYKGNLVMEYKYDMLGNMVYQNSMDAGKRWLLINALEDPLRIWDERNHEFQYFYDILHRPIQSKVLGGDGDIPLDHFYDRIFYGDWEGLNEPARTQQKQKNVIGQVVKHYDTGGLIETPEYDFKGQPKSTTRKLFKNYKDVANWTDTHLDADLENESFTFITETDALGRITKQTSPDESVITPSYNKTGLLNGETVKHHDPAVEKTYLENIQYNEKGQRTQIDYGNNVFTKFYYDEETFRLNRLETKRKNNNPLQDWYYTYDPAGNITHIKDKNIPVNFFDNEKIEGVSTYTYDALYRLVEASGRENDAALVFGDCDNWNDAPFMHQLDPNPGSDMFMRNYTQKYNYDAVGNITLMKHIANGGSWTRNYTYELTNNRLKNTTVGQGSNSFDYGYEHHPKHGYMTQMPHLDEMSWNFKEELVKTIRQKRNDGGTPETTWYQYDGEGQRIRKITEKQAAAGVAPSKKEERIYIAGYELYKKHSGDHSGLKRHSLSLMDEGHRFVMIETRNDVDDGTEKHLVRYQLHNHLGSACLEMDDSDTAKVISYEEYHPYGTTAFQANNSTVKSAAKRYRYTGMERDEESGLEYHSARYYIPWLGRWCNCDPLGLVDGMGLYTYVSNHPICIYDKNGLNGDSDIIYNDDMLNGPFEANKLSNGPPNNSDPGDSGLEDKNIPPRPNVNLMWGCFPEHPTYEQMNEWYQNAKPWLERAAQPFKDVSSIDIAKWILFEYPTWGANNAPIDTLLWDPNWEKTDVPSDLAECLFGPSIKRIKGLGITNLRADDLLKDLNVLDFLINNPDVPEHISFLASESKDIDIFRENLFSNDEFSYYVLGATIQILHEKWENIIRQIKPEFDLHSDKDGREYLIFNSIEHNKGTKKELESIAKKKGEFPYSILGNIPTWNDSTKKFGPINPTSVRRKAR